MTKLTINLLGRVALELDGRPVRFTRRSALALAVYLACAGRPQSRAALATLIAGESADQQAAMALSNALRDLRAVLGGHLQADTQAVALAPGLEIVLDVAALEAAARADARADLSSLRAAALLYGGEFARGLSLRGAPEFDEWLRHERERLRTLYLLLLEQLASAEERAGDRKGAIATTRRLLAEEPWREEAHRSLMRLLARDGQRAAALLQFAQCRAVLQRELGAEPQPETLRLHEQLQAGPQSPRHNLPARATTFVDRPTERALLREQLQRPDRRLITIAGIGGAGKTRLALELAAEFTRPDLPDELVFPDGVFLVTCGEADQSGPAPAQQLPQTILRSIGVAAEPGADPTTVLLRWLAPRRALLVIDNAESEPAVASLARAILASAPDVRLLATSRLRLRLEAEWVCDLGGLDVPSSPDAVLNSGAGQLFLERARAGQLQHVPGPDDYPHIVRICQLVHGLPLGIVLAAGRLRSLSCAAIAEHLAHDLDLLVSNAVDLPARQRSLGAVLRWSYAQLQPDEARSLRLMAVFPDEFDLKAAQEVSQCTPPVLESLTDYGLLTRTSERTYSLHPLVRQIAAEELARAPDELAQAELRHAGHFAQLAAGIGERLERETAALSELTARWSDLRKSWDWAVTQRSREHITRLRPGMNQLWYALSVFREGAAQCEQAAAALGNTHEPQAMSAADSREVVELLLTAAWLHIHDNNTTPALLAIEQARAFAPHDDDRLSARIDLLQGNQLYLQTRYRAARPMLERALASSMERADRGAVIALLSVLARLAYRQGDVELMQTTVVVANQRFGDRDTALDLVLLRYAEAHLAVEAGDTAPAKTLLARHVSHTEAADHYQLRFWHWSLQVAVFTAEGRLGKAEELMGLVMPQAEVFGSSFVSSHATIMLADTLVAQGAWEQADPLFARALHRATQLAIPRQQCAALLGRAYCAELGGDAARAQALAGEALRIACDEAYARLERRALMILGRSMTELGRHGEAVEAFALARAADEVIGHRVLAAEAAVAQAQVHRRQGRLGEAVGRIEPSLHLLLRSELVGAENAVRTLGDAASILLEAGDPRGPALRERARAMLTRRAALVAPQHRQSFLELTPAHRALLRQPEPLSREVGLGR